MIGRPILARALPRPADRWKRASYLLKYTKMLFIFLCLRSVLLGLVTRFLSILEGFSYVIRMSNEVFCVFSIIVWSRYLHESWTISVYCSVVQLTMYFMSGRVKDNLRKRNWTLCGSHLSRKLLNFHFKVCVRLRGLRILWGDHANNVKRWSIVKVEYNIVRILMIVAQEDCGLYAKQKKCGATLSYLPNSERQSLHGELLVGTQSI